MSSEEIAIEVRDLDKCYQIYERPQDRLKQSVMPRLNQFLGKPPVSYYREFWALRGVSFRVRKGETIGIIGRNGSGKSTLLQIICGTLTPSGGSVETDGRVAALLELGAGFNTDFTGRENVYLNGSVLGLGRDEIEERFDTIAEFAGIGDFMDQPVRTYSSGMVVRLGFSVASNVDPEILIVDEALAVGDELFQRKCFSRIEAIKAKGATILFVSHSGSTIIELCDHAILLDEGERIAEGLPKRIVGRYQKLIYAPAERRALIRQEVLDKFRLELEDAARSAQDPNREPAAASIAAESRSGADETLRESFDPTLRPASTIAFETHGALIESSAIFNAGGERVNNLIGGRVYRYGYNVLFNEAAVGVSFGMLIKTVAGVELGGGATVSSTADAIAYVAAGSVYRVEFRFTCNLNPGVYFLNAGVVGLIDGTETYLHRLLDVAMFRVLPESGGLSTGIVDFNCVPELALTNDASA